MVAHEADTVAASINIMSLYERFKMRDSATGWVRHLSA